MLSGVLHLRPLTQAAEVSLRLMPQPLQEDGEAVGSRLVRQDEPHEVRLQWEAAGFGGSLAGRPVCVRLAVEDEVLVRQTLVPKLAGREVSAGPIVLSAAAFDDRAGVVSLEVTISNEFGVAVVLHAESFVLQLADTREGRRLAGMLRRVLESTPVLLPEDVDTGLKGRLAGTKRETTTADFWRRVENVVATYAQLHHYFEKSARFRLQQSERMTTLSRVSSITHRTLDFIATHPEELLPVENATGILCRGRHWLPVRTVDETHQKSFDIEENRCLVAFLRTVLMAAQEAMKMLGELTSLDQSAVFQTAVAPLYEEKRSLLSQLQDLVASYSRGLMLNDATPLTNLPEPSPIFISSSPYRRLYELMRTWFDSRQPGFSDVRGLLTISRSSRIYEHYVLSLLVEALGTPTSRRRVAYDGAPRRMKASAVFNAFVFERAGKEVTLFYEPLIPAGVRQGGNEVGLVRTMTFDFSPTGDSRSDVAQAYWTPDYVIRVREGQRCRYWVADAKYQTWPSFLEHYAEETIVKYLYATAPQDPGDLMQGLMIFCGKSHGSTVGRRSFRNADVVRDRAPAAEMLTLVGEAKRDAQAVKGWVQGL